MRNIYICNYVYIISYLMRIDRRKRWKDLIKKKKTTKTDLDYFTYLPINLKFMISHMVLETENEKVYNRKNLRLINQQAISLNELFKISHRD